MQHFTKTTSRKPLSLQMATRQLGQIVKISEELTATWEIKNLFYSIKICKKLEEKAGMWLTGLWHLLAWNGVWGGRRAMTSTYL